MWKLTIEDDEQKQISLPLVHTDYGVGRDESNEIRLTERNISRKHATIRKNSDGWVLRDLESYNGTYVNGLRVAGEQHVNHGDIVQLGDYRLEFVDEARLMPAVQQHAATPQALPPHHRPDRLVVVVGPQPGQEFYLDREHFSMGRSEDADISVNHSSVSRFHAELFAVGNGRYEIIDKGSANGIRINGQEVRRGFIEAGDALELGDVRLRFVGAGKIFKAGFDRNLALPAITGFDAAIKAPGAGSKPKASSSSILKMVAVGALFGVVGVGAAAAYVASRDPNKQVPTSATADPPADDAGRKLLEEARKLHEEGKLDEAHQKVSQIPEGSNALKDPSVAKIEGDWADKLFKEAESHPDDPQKQVDLLWQIRNDKNLDEERRRKAQQALKNIGVELPEELEDIKPDAPAPTVRPTAYVPRPPPTASSAPVGPGQEDRAALNDPKKKFDSLRGRPVNTLSEAELKQLIGLCQQNQQPPSCMTGAAKRLKELQANPSTSAKKP